MADESLGKLGFEIEIPFAQLQAKINALTNSVKNSSERQSKALKNPWNNLQISASRALQSVQAQTSRTFGQIGGVIKRSLQIGTAAIGAFSVFSVKNAMEMQETNNLFAVSFDKLQSKAQNSLSTIAKAYGGLNQTSLKNYSATLNTMVQSMGLSGDEALKLSTELTKLTYDFASFYNSSPEKAFDKIRAGITGESEPLKAWGIIINDAVVKQYALKNGLASAGKELTDSQKAMARYFAILDKGKQAVGDWTRSLKNGSVTVKLKLEQEKFKTLQQEVGIKLLPSFTKILEVFGNTMTRISPSIIGVFDRLGKWFESVPDVKIQTFVDNMIEFGKVIGQVIGNVLSFVAKFPKLSVAIFTATKILGPASGEILRGLIKTTFASLKSELIKSLTAVKLIKSQFNNLFNHGELLKAYTGKSSNPKLSASLAHAYGYGVNNAGQVVKGGTKTKSFFDTSKIFVQIGLAVKNVPALIKGGITGILTMFGKLGAAIMSVFNAIVSLPGLLVALGAALSAFIGYQGYQWYKNTRDYYKNKNMTNEEASAVVSRIGTLQSKYNSVTNSQRYKDRVKLQKTEFKTDEDRQKAIDEYQKKYKVGRYNSKSFYLMLNMVHDKAVEFADKTATGAKTLVGKYKTLVQQTKDLSKIFDMNETQFKLTRATDLYTNMIQEQNKLYYGRSNGSLLTMSGSEISGGQTGIDENTKALIKEIRELKAAYKQEAYIKDKLEKVKVD